MQAGESLRLKDFIYLKGMKTIHLVKDNRLVVQIKVNNFIFPNSRMLQRLHGEILLMMYFIMMILGSFIKLHILVSHLTNKICYSGEKPPPFCFIVDILIIQCKKLYPLWRLLVVHITLIVIDVFVYTGHYCGQYKLLNLSFRKYNPARRRDNKNRKRSCQRSSNHLKYPGYCSTIRWIKLLIRKILL